MKPILRSLAELPDVELGVPATRTDIDAHLAGPTLPAAHLDVLCCANGMTTYGGYFRLFGVGPQPPIDLASWNDPHLWKFAWPSGLDRFVCFGETAWGDQYAYDRNDLAADAATAPVYFVEALGMAPELIAPDFESFLEREFLRNARRPYDEVLIQVRDRLGNLATNEHIAHMPSLLLTETEDPESVVKIDAIAAMILGGDLYSQLQNARDDQAVKSVDTYTDARGRSRLRVLWS